MLLEYNADDDTCLVKAVNADPSTLYRLQHKATFKAINPLSEDLPDITQLVNRLGPDFRESLHQKFDLSDRTIRRILSGQTKHFDVYEQILNMLMEQLNIDCPDHVQTAAWVMYLVQRFSETQLKAAIDGWTPDDTHLETLLLRTELETTYLEETDPDV